MAAMRRLNSEISTTLRSRLMGFHHLVQLTQQRGVKQVGLHGREQHVSGQQLGSQLCDVRHQLRQRQLHGINAGFVGLGLDFATVPFVVVERGLHVAVRLGIGFQQARALFASKQQCLCRFGKNRRCSAPPRPGW